MLYPVLTTKKTQEKFLLVQQYVWVCALVSAPAPSPLPEIKTRWTAKELGSTPYYL